MSETVSLTKKKTEASRAGASKIDASKAAVSVRSLLNFIDKKGMDGYDPIDALNSKFLGGLNSKIIRLGSTIFFRVFPVNLRALFNVKKAPHPKGMGLFLSAYSKLYSKGFVPSLKEADETYLWLMEHRTEGYSGNCWGYNYPWQDRYRLLEAWSPSVVATAYVGHAIMDDIVDDIGRFGMRRGLAGFEATALID